MEAAPGFDKIGVPKPLTRVLFKKFNLSHDVEPKHVEKITVKDLGTGILIRVNNDGSAGAILKLRNEWVIFSYDPESGKVTVHHEEKFSDAKKYLGIKKGNGKFYYIKNYSRDTFRARDKKPSSDVKDVERRERVGRLSNENIFPYLNKVFLPRIRNKLQNYVDEIYDTLRDIPRGYSATGKYDPNHLEKYSIIGNPMISARQRALQAAEFIEAVIDRGFTKDLVSKFIRTYGNYYKDIGSYYKNRREFLRLLDEEPAAAAKFAKILLLMGKNEYNKIKDLKMKILKDKMT